ncbi:MAG: aminoacyl-tRNA hydrolase [Thermodesulfobacteriota bacterium]
MPEYLLAGLGNPGTRYARTRHNIGFRLVDTLGERYGCSNILPMETSEIRIGTIEGIAVGLIKPLTYMNCSGPPIVQFADFCGVPPSRVIVVHDDMDLVFGKIKIKEKGGSGGHKGVQSIIDAFLNDGFIRVRLGIGHPPAGVSGPDYVLSAFCEAEERLLPGVLKTACDAVVTILCRGTKEAMNRFHRSGVDTVGQPTDGR